MEVVKVFYSNLLQPTINELSVRDALVFLLICHRFHLGVPGVTLSVLFKKRKAFLYISDALFSVTD